MGVKLLLADDSITIQKVVGIIFSNEDYDLTVVDNGVLALEKAQEIKPAIMLIDALMPGKSGFEVCQEVRQNPALKNTPLLLMTGAFEPFDEEKAKQCGADDFISKPFESQQLVEKVKALLDIGMERSASVPPPVASVAAVQEPEVPIIPPVAGPWEEAAPEIEASFEPIPEIFDDSLVNVEPEIEPAGFDLGATSFEEPAEFDLGATPFEEPAEMGVEVVEAAPGDDPWGVFDLVDLDELPSTTVQAEPDSFAVSETEEPPALELYTDETSPEEAVEVPAVLEPPTLETAGDEGFQSKWGPLEEEVFAYQQEELTPPGETFAVGMGEPLASLVNEPEQFAAEIIEEPAILAHETIAPVAAPAAVAEIAATPSAAPQMPSLGEEQLKAILSQLSRETIEKIVWEVVPDLAENLIREEIRKLKQGFGV